MRISRTSTQRRHACSWSKSRCTIGDYPRCRSITTDSSGCPAVEVAQLDLRAHSLDLSGQLLELRRELRFL
jgi:hypothetical protein